MMQAYASSVGLRFNLKDDYTGIVIPIINIRR